MDEEKFYERLKALDKKSKKIEQIIRGLQLIKFETSVLQEHGSFKIYIPKEKALEVPLKKGDLLTIWARLRTKKEAAMDD